MTIRVLVVLCALAGVPAAFAAQAPGPGPGEIAVEPIRCWWRTDRSAVHLGERFTLTLTCRVVDTPSVTVTPSVQQLEPGAVLLTPFESVGGERHEDVVSPPYRYLQFEYLVRFLGEGAFGTDVAIPQLTVTYNVQAAAGGGAQGRDERYVLPAIPMRVASLAPAGAADIRDANAETFGTIEGRRFRSTAALVGAGLFFGLAVVLAGVAGVRTASGRRATTTTEARPIPSASVLQGCLRALREVEGDAARAGWSPALSRKAAAAFRIAGAAAMGRPVAQAPANGRTVPDGQLLLRRGWLRPRRVLVSAPTTPDAIARHLENGTAPSARRRAVVAPIEAALRTFTSYAYGRGGDADSAALAAALDDGMKAIRRLQMQSLWTPGASRPPAGAAERGWAPRR